MKLTDFQRLTDSKVESEARSKKFSAMINSPRNARLKMHRDYYDGIHWVYGNGKVTTTRSTKVIWGKGGTYQGSENDKLARRDSGHDDGYSAGLIQTKNYIKLFTQTYQDFILGDEEAEIEVTLQPEIKKGSVEEGEKQETVDQYEEANEFLKDLWVDAPEFIKTQTPRMVINTVGSQSLSWDSVAGKYVVQLEDSMQLYPIYDRDRHVGTMQGYMISGEDAKLLYGIANLKKKEAVTYMEAYYPDEAGDYWMARYVDGKLIGETDADGKSTAEAMKLPEEINFDPYTIFPNIDHPYRKYDEKHLEDSEIFNWINSNDTLNSTETIEFITNLFMAMPKLGLDFVAIEKLGLDVTSAAFQQALSKYQYAPNAIDNVPIKPAEGVTLGDSFYKGKDTIKDGLFEFAGIPQFVINAEGLVNIAADTIELGMSILIRKINQKRQQLIKGMKETSLKALKAKGYVDSDTTINTSDLIVTLPDITSVNMKDMLKALMDAVDRNIVSEKYATKEFLNAIGREQDLDEVIEEKQIGLLNVRGDIEKQKSLVKNEILVEKELKTQARDQAELDEVQQRINQAK